MIGFKSTLLNATLALTVALPLAAAGLFTSAGSAQAVTLNGSIGIGGTSVIPKDGINPLSTSIKFVDVDGVDAYGDFAAFLPNLNLGTGITISTLNLTKIANLPATLLSTQATYSTGIYTPFINFGLRTLGSTNALLTFDLDDSVVTRTRKSNSISDVATDGITGKFNFNGKTIATGSGFMNASVSGASSTYQLTLEAVSVPEPTTILGLGAVGAVMAMSRRRKSVVQ